MILTLRPDFAVVELQIGEMSAVTLLRDLKAAGHRVGDPGGAAEDEGERPRPEGLHERRCRIGHPECDAPHGRSPSTSRPRPHI